MHYILGWDKIYIFLYIYSEKNSLSQNNNSSFVTTAHTNNSIVNNNNSNSLVSSSGSDRISDINSRSSSNSSSRASPYSEVGNSLIMGLLCTFVQVTVYRYSVQLYYTVLFFGNSVNLYGLLYTDIEYTCTGYYVQILSTLVHVIVYRYQIQ